MVGGELLSGRAFPVGERDIEWLPRQIRDPRPVVAGSESVAAPVAAGALAESEAGLPADIGLENALSALRDLHALGRAARVLVVPTSDQPEPSIAALALARRLSTLGRTILVDANSAHPVVDRRSMAPSSLADDESDTLGLSELWRGPQASRRSFTGIRNRACTWCRSAGRPSTPTPPAA